MLLVVCVIVPYQLPHNGASVSLFMGQLSILATAAISRSPSSFSNAHSSSKNLLDYLFTYLFIYLSLFVSISGVASILYIHVG
jgi:hypothetical protein